MPIVSATPGMWPLFASALKDSMRRGAEPAVGVQDLGVSAEAALARAQSDQGAPGAIAFIDRDDLPLDDCRRARPARHGTGSAFGGQALPAKLLHEGARQTLRSLFGDRQSLRR